MAYHSALHAPIEATPVNWWAGHGSVAFAAPVAARMRDEFAACDVLYAEPPWEAGYNEFHKRAGVVPDRSYGDWLKLLDAAFLGAGVPAVIIVGKKGAKFLRPDIFLPATLNGANALAAAYGIDGLPVRDTNIVSHLAARFQRIGDPCCGYGRAGRAFAQAGKTFVMSDVNPACIGHIASEAGEWFA